VTSPAEDIADWLGDMYRYGDPRPKSGHELTTALADHFGDTLTLAHIKAAVESVEIPACSECGDSGWSRIWVDSEGRTLPCMCPTGKRLQARLEAE
jgi:hypothetical protein